jgi:hypothetical protein
MMPAMLRFAFVALLLAACGGSSGTTTDDLSAQGDFALPVLSGCRQVDECASGCTSAACVTACETGVDSASVSAYEALATCALTSCTHATDAGIPDLGAGPCASASDTTAACTKCLGAAQQGMAACEAEYATCTAE